jgi:hypothetical protein
MKKIIAILIALTLCLAFAVSATAAPATDVGTKYDLHDGFGYEGYLDNTAFSFMARNKADKTLVTDITYSDGTDGVKDGAYAGAFRGYYVKGKGVAFIDTLTDDVNDYHYIVWYPGAQHEAVVAFNAPVEGTYSYEYETLTVWGCNEGDRHVYVEVDGAVHNGNELLSAKGTAKEETRKTFTGTVELDEGGQILFVNDPSDNSAGDNLYIVKLIVTLDKKAEIPPTDDPTHAPDTNDALVAVIALAAVAGTALVITKKH